MSEINQDSLTPEELVIYRKGMKQAWATALYLSLVKKEDLKEVFPTSISSADIMVDILSHYTPDEVKNRLDNYYKNKEDK